MKLGIIAGCISILAFIPYLISIAQRKTKPNFVTWWVWSVLAVLLFFSYKASGATDTLFVPFIYMLAPCAVALLSLKYGESSWSRFDLCCLAGALAGALLWLILKNATMALMIFIIVDLFGILPTVRKTYFFPEQEDRLAWFLMMVANVINICAAEKKTFFIVLYPAYMVFTGGVILGLSFRKVF